MWFALKTGIQVLHYIRKKEKLKTFVRPRDKSSYLKANIHPFVLATIGLQSLKRYVIHNLK